MEFKYFFFVQEFEKKLSIKISTISKIKKIDALKQKYAYFTTLDIRYAHFHFINHILVRFYKHEEHKFWLRYGKLIKNKISV